MMSPELQSMVESEKKAELRAAGIALLGRLVSVLEDLSSRLTVEVETTTTTKLNPR